MHAWLCEDPVGVDALNWKELPTPEPKAGEVRVRIEAASLNFPDLLIVQNKYQMKPPTPFVPGAEFAGVVEASSRAVDAASGTTRMQLVVDNSAGELMPGAFANTRIELPANLEALSIPSAALIFDQKGLRVATVDEAGKVTLVPVTLSRDLGQVVEIATGLGPNDRVIDSPPDGLVNGDRVRVVTPPKSAAAR
mgnify:CR=1 FL=1